MDEKSSLISYSLPFIHTIDPDIFIYTQCPLIRDSVNLRLVCPKIWLKIWLVVSHSCPIYFVFSNGYFDLYMYSSKRGIYQIDMFHFNFDFYPYALFMIHTTTITEWWNFKRRMIACPKVWNCETRLSLIYPKKSNSLPKVSLTLCPL